MNIVITGALGHIGSFLLIRLPSEFEPDLKIKFVKTNIMNQLSYQVLNEKFTNLGFQFTGDIKLGIKKTILLLKQSNSS